MFYLLSCYEVMSGPEVLPSALITGREAADWESDGAGQGGGGLPRLGFLMVIKTGHKPSLLHCHKTKTTTWNCLNTTTNNLTKPRG